MARCPGVQGICATLLVRLALAGVDDPGSSADLFLLPSHAAVGLGKNLFPLFARALDLSPDFFDDKVRTCRCLLCSLDSVEWFVMHDVGCSRRETLRRLCACCITRLIRDQSTSV